MCDPRQKKTRRCLEWIPHPFSAFILLRFPHFRSIKCTTSLFYMLLFMNGCLRFQNTFLIKLYALDKFSPMIAENVFIPMICASSMIWLCSSNIVAGWRNVIFSSTPMLCITISSTGLFRHSRAALGDCSRLTEMEEAHEAAHELATDPRLSHLRMREGVHARW